MGVSSYSVNIVGLSNTVHFFEFEVDNAFFGQYGNDLISEGTVKAMVTLDKRETFIDATFNLAGSIKLICDRSLDPFDHVVRTEKKLVFKYGDSDEELSDEIVMIHRDTDTLKLGQYIFEFIALEVPMKKLHPRFQGEDDDDDAAEGKIIYSSKPSSDDNDSEDIDPRWEILKKLK